MIDEKKADPNWLHAAMGKPGAPQPPALNSDRIKGFLGRALLKPGDLSAVEVQELAAAVLTYLVSAQKP